MSEERQRAALVTGASSGIGREIARRLCDEGRVVYGIGRNFERPEDKELLENPLFHPVVCDLLDTAGLLDTVRRIRAEVKITALISNAGSAYYGVHEMLTNEQIEEIVRLDLEVPMLLTKQFLPEFKKSGGTFIYIASVTAQNLANPHGAAYGAAKAGLLSFARSIFEEGRKCGVQVTAVLPDMTRTDLYRNADFEAEPDAAAGASLAPSEVADAVMYALSRPAGVVVPEIVLQPQLRRIAKKPHSPYGSRL